MSWGFFMVTTINIAIDLIFIINMIKKHSSFYIFVFNYYIFIFYYLIYIFNFVIIIFNLKVFTFIFNILLSTFTILKVNLIISTMLIFNLEAVMKARQIERPYSFLVKAGISPHSAVTLLNSESRSFRLDHVEILCEILHCEPNDLIAFVPNKTQKTIENHPLKKFIEKEENLDWQQTLKTASIAQLKEVSKLINQSKENKEL